MSMVNGQMEKIDNEWLALILKAKELGLSVDQVREFLSGNIGPDLLHVKKASYKN